MRAKTSLVFFVSLTLCVLSADAEEEFGFAKNTSELSGEESQGGESQPLFEERFRVPPNFESGSKNAQQLLEEAGIVFSERAFAKYNSGLGQLIVVNTKDELDLVHSYLGCGMGNYREHVLYFFLEQIEVDASLYHNWMFENRLSGDGMVLRKQAQNWLKADDATLLDTVSLTGRSGQRCRVESGEETIYTIEYDPHQVPNEVILEENGLSNVVIPVVPAAFETRRLGTSLQVDVILGADSSTLDIALSPESVEKVGLIAWPPVQETKISSAVVPLFHTVKFSTQVTLRSGTYRFLGTTRPKSPAVESRKHPIVMSFLRADVALIRSENPVGVRRLVSP